MFLVCFGGTAIRISSIEKIEVEAGLSGTSNVWAYMTGGNKESVCCINMIGKKAERFVWELCSEIEDGDVIDVKYIIEDFEDGYEDEEDEGREVDSVIWQR